MHATIDFETKSECSLKTAGTYRYALDPTTDILCLAFRLPSWHPDRTGLWHPAFPTLGIPAAAIDDDVWELFDWIHHGGLVEAHNAFFERCIWAKVQVPRYGWPEIAPHQWRCSAAKAAALALPRSLDAALDALRLDIRKDSFGGKVMLRMSKPRRSRKAERAVWDEHAQPHPVVFHLDRVSLDDLWTYCRQDVLAESALSAALPDLSPAEQEMYLLDQRINWRGFQIDPTAVSAALSLITSETCRLNSQLAEITHGAVTKATQRKPLTAWAETQGLKLPNTKKETISAVLDAGGDLSSDLTAALSILRSLGKSSTAKYVKMQQQMSPEDGRVRGGLLYHGASTGRWSGSGVQPHNFPKGKLPHSMEATWDGLLAGKPCEGDVMEVLSWALRGAITATPGRELVVADYAGIEARVLLWLAEDEDGLDIFREGRDIYCEMAGTIYGRPITKADKDERALGKVAILGLGFQMGWVKFIDTALIMGGITLTDALAQQTVSAYRDRMFPKVKAMWQDQQEAAIRAVSHRGRPVSCGRVTWESPLDSRFLFCTLPSGRRLAYPDPEVRPKATPWGEIRPSLTYMGMNSFTREWSRQTGYGGLLVENMTQAVARDLMAAALQRCEQSAIYDPVLSVHDELIAEADAGLGDVRAFEALMAELPPWADGCPVVAEGWKGFRYHK